jgi:hypothetical protein
MTALLPAHAALDPEEALARVDPDRREFAILYSEGKVRPAELMKTAGISSATYYRWIKDDAILAYTDAVGRDVGRRGKRRLRQEVDGAIENIIAIQTDPDATPTMLKASLEILDRAGVTREEITRSGQGGGDTVVQINMAIPINTNAYDEQQERRRRREEAALEATYADGTPQ